MEDASSKLRPDGAGLFFCTCDRILSRIEAAGLFIACLMILAMMVLIAADAISRYLFTVPLTFTMDLVTMYMLPGAIFLAMSFAMRVGAHVNVDLVLHQMWPRLLRMVTGLTLMVAIVVIALTVWATGHKAFDAWDRASVVTGLHSWIIWPSEALVPAGLSLMLLRMTHMSIENLFAAFTGRMEFGGSRHQGLADPVEEAI